MLPDILTFAWLCVVSFIGLLQWRSASVFQENVHDKLTLMIRSLEVEKTALHEAYDETIAGWARTLELRDIETAGHSERVVTMSMDLGKALGMENGELVTVKRGALLHDIGKLAIPDSILLKRGKLTQDERIIMENHPNLAYDLLRAILFLKSSIDIPYCHHEKWNGLGYPRGLFREQIPLAARLFTVVDVYDALTHDRPYRAAWPKLRTLEHIHMERGISFDPYIVDRFLELMSREDA